MKPTEGNISWDGESGIKRRRLASALVDSPGVNEPEQHLSVRDLVTEDLALIPRRYRGALLSKPWLKVNSFEDIADRWTEQLPPDRRVELLTALALANPHTDLLVVDSPDRHTAETSEWLPRLEQLAYDAGRPLAVVATVAAIPAGWTGPAAAVGNAAQRPEDAPATAEAVRPEEPAGPEDAIGPQEEDLLLETEDAK
jgi:hypothetical protein